MKYRWSQLWLEFLTALSFVVPIRIHMWTTVEGHQVRVRVPFSRGRIPQHLKST